MAFVTTTISKTAIGLAAVVLCFLCWQHYIGPTTAPSVISKNHHVTAQLGDVQGAAVRTTSTKSSEFLKNQKGTLLQDRKLRWIPPLNPLAEDASSEGKGKGKGSKVPSTKGSSKGGSRGGGKTSKGKGSNMPSTKGSSKGGTRGGGNTSKNNAAKSCKGSKGKGSCEGEAALPTTGAPPTTTGAPPSTTGVPPTTTAGTPTGSSVPPVVIPTSFSGTLTPSAKTSLETAVTSVVLAKLQVAFPGDFTGFQVTLKS